MLDGMKVLGIIPARGGSKGIPGKNIAELAGKPLLGWTIDAARESKYLDRIILSSDDPEIQAVARSFGCDVPFTRPPGLATDESPTIDTVCHAIQMIRGYDYVVLLQPTSPLRNAGDIDECIELCIRSKAGSCVSVTEVSASPHWMFWVDPTLTLRPILGKKSPYLRRQDAPPAYVLNGAVYVSATERLLRERSLICDSPLAYVMPRERSLDIDEPLDLEIVSALLAKE